MERGQVALHVLGIGCPSGRSPFTAASRKNCRIADILAMRVLQNLSVLPAEIGLYIGSFFDGQYGHDVIRLFCVLLGIVHRYGKACPAGKTHGQCGRDYSIGMEQTTLVAPCFI